MIIYNPRKDSVVAKFDGATYHFRGGERKDIFNTFAAKHILGRWGKYGLVDITYNEKLAKQYVDYEVFVHEKGLEGLLTYQETLIEKDQNFKAFDMECGDKKTVERIRFAKQAKAVLTQIKELQQDIKEYEMIDQTDLLEAKEKALLAEVAKLQEEAKRINGISTNKSSNTTSNRAS